MQHILEPEQDVLVADPGFQHCIHTHPACSAALHTFPVPLSAGTHRTVAERATKASIFPNPQSGFPWTFANSSKVLPHMFLREKV
jgi:hypothetical protein